MYCARHPNVETNLRCGKCDQFICPKCAVQTPVGARCPDCAKLARLPTFQVSVVDHLKLAGVGLGLAVGGGLLWQALTSYASVFSLIVFLGIAYAVSELGSIAVNRKRGKGLQIIACASVAIGYLVAVDVYISLFGILALAVGISVAINRFR